MTIPFIPRRTVPSAEFHLGSTSFDHHEGDFEATLVVTPGAETRVRLTKLAWGAGVGWFAQQTLEVGLEEARQIAALLNRAPQGMQPALGDLPTPADVPATERAPTNLAEARAHRVKGRTRSAPGPVSHAGRVPTPIAGADLAALPHDGSANG